MNTKQLYNTLIDLKLFTDSELYLVTDINGYNEETLNDCIYSRYGYKDLEQMIESQELEI